MGQGKGVMLFMMTIFIFLPLSSLKAEYIADTRETLRGIKSILVVVKSFHPEAQEYGFTADTIQKDVALQLERAGIAVIPLKKFPTLNPYLLIEATIVYSGRDLFTYSLSVALKQLVYLGSNPDLSLDAITWSKLVAGTAGKKELGKAVRSLVKETVDIFLNDYRAVNPQQESSP